MISVVRTEDAVYVDITGREVRGIKMRETKIGRAHV